MFKAVPTDMLRFPVWMHQFGSTSYFYHWSGRQVRWLGLLTATLFMIGLAGGLVFAPPDYQQGDSYRIIYVHVPSAWMSLFTYMVMAAAAVIVLVWRIKVAEAVMASCAPLGASFTLIALVTGSLWGKPMWGTYWVWDARLTSELLLLFLYLGVIALDAAIPEKRKAARATALLAIVGVVNIPVIHYSVVWWNTLHQGATISKLDAPSIHINMLIPLLVMTVAFMLYFLTVLLMRARVEILNREKHTHWVNQLLEKAAT